MPVLRIYFRLLAFLFFGASAWLNAASAIKRVRFLADSTGVWYERVRSPTLWWLPEIMPAVTICAAAALGVLLVWRAVERPGALLLAGMLACLVLFIGDANLVAGSHAFAGMQWLQLQNAVDHLTLAGGVALLVRFAETLRLGAEYEANPDNHYRPLTGSPWFWAVLALVTAIVFLGRTYVLLALSNLVRQSEGLHPLTYVQDRWLFAGPLSINPMGVARAVVGMLWLGMFAGLIGLAAYSLTTGYQVASGTNRSRIGWVLILFQIWILAFILVRFVPVTSQYVWVAGDGYGYSAGLHAMGLLLVVMIALGVFGTGALGSDLVVRRTAVYGFAVFTGVIAAAVMQEILTDFVVERLGLPKEVGTLGAAGIGAGVWHIARNRIRPLATRILTKTK